MLVSIQLYMYSLTLKGHTRENQALKVGEKPQRRKDQVPSTSAMVPQHDRWKCYLNVAKFIVGILAL